MSKGKCGITLCVVLLLAVSGHVFAMDCQDAVRELNRQLRPKIDEQELVMVLRSLNDSGNRHLPEQFITKKGARSLGWRPGSDLWRVPSLRGPKRLLFADDGLRMVTVDHYRSFMEVPSCK